MLSLADYKQRCESILDAVTESIVVLDPQARIVAFNNAVSHQLGYEGPSLLGQDINRIVSDQAQGQLAELLSVAHVTNGSLSMQADACRADGTRFPARIALSVIPQLDQHVVCSILNNTRQVHAESSLNLAKEEAERTLANLKQKERIIELSLLGAGAGYWHLDFASGTLTLDDHALAMFGLDKPAFFGRYADWANRIHPDDFPWTQGALMEAMSDEQESNFVWNYRVVWPDGTVRHLHVTANIERDADNTPLSAYGLNFDVTADMDAEIALRKAKEDAEIANQAKSSFLAAMSHEIRTPMNGVVGMIDVLGHTPLNSEQQNLIKTIRDSSFGLLSIIDDILDFSKIEAGRLEIEHIPLDIGSVLEGVSDTLYSLAEKKNIQLFTYCDPSLPRVYGDPVRLRQILFNLGGNATKFTGNDPAVRGRIVIRVEMAPSHVAGRVRVAMHVEDNGIGIAPDAQSKLFRPFSQAENSTTRRYGGTGLGLTICQRLADMMGGQIELHSIEGKGSVFSVFLELEPAPPDPSTLRHDLMGLTIPLLCPDPAASSFLESYLAHAGATVCPVPDSESLSLQVKELTVKHVPSVIVVDTMGDRRIGQLLKESLLEELSGAQLHFVFLERGQRRHPRIEGSGSLAIDLDAIHREKLLLAISAAAGRTSLEAEPTVQSVAASRAAMTTAEAEAHGQLILIAEDNPTNQLVLMHQLAVLGHAAEVAENGKEALEKWHSGRYGMLLTDCHMPEMDGYELARAIRTEENGKQHLPIVAITADALKGTDRQCQAAGMDDYLSKPIQLDLLREVIRKWMPAPTQSEVAGSDALSIHAIPPTPDDPDEISVVDTQSLVEVLGTDDPVMLADFYLDFLRSGEQTLDEIQQAYLTHNTEDIGRLAHRLKSSARTVGAHPLADCCLALEQAGKQGDMSTVNAQMRLFPSLFSQVRTWITRFEQDGSEPQP